MYGVLVKKSSFVCVLRFFFFITVLFFLPCMSNWNRISAASLYSSRLFISICTLTITLFFFIIILFLVQPNTEGFYISRFHLFAQIMASSVNRYIFLFVIFQIWQINFQIGRRKKNGFNLFMQVKNLTNFCDYRFSVSQLKSIIHLHPIDFCFL